jgi:RNA methyltransferase, TrmH family
LLESLQNEQVKLVVSLQRRKVREETQLYVIEGWRFVEEAIRRNAPLKKVYVSLKPNQSDYQSLLKELQTRNIPFEEVDNRVLRKMSATEEPQGILAVVHQTKYTWSDVHIDKGSVLLVLDGIQDPGNLGTILRTALSAGVRHVCLTSGTVDVYNSKVLRSTMGAIFSLILLSDLSPDEVLDFCRKQKLNVIMGDTKGQSLYRTNLANGPFALVVGNEGNGPSLAFRRADVQRVTIPMAQEVESLNVAMATGILLYEIARQRDFL